MKKKQEGVVLVVSLVFLIALTALAAAMMQNTTSDIKVAGASEEKVAATQEVVSSSDEVIYKQMTKASGTNGFTHDIAAYPVSETVTAPDTTAQITVANPNDVEAGCPHSRSASSIQVFSCNVLSITVTRKYGRLNKQEVVVNTGIAQQLLNVGG